MTRGAPYWSQNKAKMSHDQWLNKIATEKWRGHGCSLGHGSSPLPYPQDLGPPTIKLPLDNVFFPLQSYTSMNKISKRESHMNVPAI